MTDWDYITECIQRAMQAVDETQHASDQLRTSATPENLDTFKTQMQVLCKRLNTLQNIFENADSFFIHELTDILNQRFSGKRASYRPIRDINDTTV